MNRASKLPLKGKTVVLTRAKDQNSEAHRIFEYHGARVLELPALVIGPPDNWAPLDNALIELNSFEWIIFSSSNGIHAVEKRLKLIGKSLSNKPEHLKVAVVGKKTAQVLKDFNVTPDFVPPEFVADSLIEHFPFAPIGLRILIPRVQTGGRTVLGRAFLEQGAIVHEVPAYESKCPEAIPIETLDSLRNLEVDFIVFTSSKTAAHTYKLIQKFFGDQNNNILDEVKLISIGPQTSIGCRKYFKRVDNQAMIYDLDGIVKACIESIHGQDSK